MKKFIRVFAFGKVCIFKIIKLESKFKFYFLRLHIFNINIKSNFYKFNSKNFKLIKNYDNYYYYFRNYLIAKLEVRDVPYEYLNKIRNFIFLRRFIKHFINKLIRIRLKNKIKKHKKIIVLFFVSRISCFFWTRLYSYFKNDPLYDVHICVIPFSYFGEKEMQRIYLETHACLEKLGVNLIDTYDVKTKKFLDIKKYHPDIIFHNKSWYKHVPKQYRLVNFTSAFNFIIEYGISGAKNPDGHFNLDSHWLADIYFMPSSIHFNMAKELSKIKAKNCVYLGYPKLDDFFDSDYVPKNVWKPQNKLKKKIIWAPHWLFFSNSPYVTSVFGELYNFMLEISQKYKDYVQFSFKPHPMLAKALTLRKLNGVQWDESAVTSYYNNWNQSSNTQLDTGSFTDLFLTSDGLIFDSISFMAEYMVTGKPSLFTVGESSQLNFDEFGNQVFSNLYITKHLKEDIINFIESVIINGKDKMRTQRQTFIKQCLLPPNNHSASLNIFNYVKEYTICKRSNYD